MLGYLLITKGQLGFDPTIITNANGLRYFKIKRDSGEERLIIDEVIKRAHCVAGRATTCWKQYPKRDKEGELLREAMEKEVVNVARYYYHATVQVEGQDYDIRDRDYGQPIYKASSRVALLAALEGCIEGYESLYQQAGMLQRDISPNNLIINEDKDSAS
ncbi:uncharacterized protein GIQ15_03652 [Arthroderma uncinatum]|uniref:uncharacterized protein n=1 Tax=Arthroderma uncinatum TaxID=74035 RepID=UPI00144A94E4|nr:uncharacterized protein GIQ15_03652 [Arthroderma uncinatum]KAF3484328.1 hypothetical protein GIQ15_03652 [Arthroderma uncinatum]